MNTNLNRAINDYMFQCTAGVSSHPGELESLKDGLEAVVKIVREVCSVLTDEQQTEIARLVGKRVFGYREDDV